MNTHMHTNMHVHLCVCVAYVCMPSKNLWLSLILIYVTYLLEKCQDTEGAQTFINEFINCFIYINYLFLIGL